jgi:hypothetical protein
MASQYAELIFLPAGLNCSQLLSEVYTYIKELGFAELVRVNFIIIYIFLVCLFFMRVGILILVVIRGHAELIFFI